MADIHVDMYMYIHTCVYVHVHTMYKIIVNYMHCVHKLAHIQNLNCHLSFCMPIKL